MTVINAEGKQKGCSEHKGEWNGTMSHGMKGRGGRYGTESTGGKSKVGLSTQYGR